MQDEDGQILEAHSISAGLDYPGTGPEHAWLRDTGRARYVAVTDADALAAFQQLHAARGHHPGARVLARARLGAREPGDRPTLDLVCLSGRGDKDLAEVLGPERERRRARSRRAFAAVAPRARAALMPYLMGGFPDLDGVARASARPTPTNGADLVELGVPFSDPLADGPVIHAAGTAALAAGATRRRRARASRAALARASSRSCSCVTPTSSSRAAPSASPTSSRDGGVSGLIVPDLPLEEAPDVLAACDAHGIALVPLVAPTTPDERLRAIGAQARGFVYTVVGASARPASATGSPPGSTGVLARAKAATRRAGRARLRHLDARAGRRRRRAPGADGVIVGSAARAGRRRGVGEDPAAAVGALVAGLSAALDSIGCRAACGSSSPPPPAMIIWIVLWALGAKALRRVHAHAR